MTPETLAVIMGCLFAIDQALASIPSIKSNSVFQLISNIIAYLAQKKPPSA